MNYKGEWLNGKRQGQGTEIIRNKSVYTGQFVQDKFGGEGIIKDLDQEDDKFLYKGGFVNGRRHGEGEINYRNGNTYKGGF